MIRRIAALVPWCWLLVGLLHGPWAYHDLRTGHWFIGVSEVLFCLVCILLGASLLAERRKNADQPEVHP